MSLVRGAWKLLVGIKDALVLVAMLLFFGLLFAALNSRPSASAVKDGALVLNLNGPIVEQPEEVAPLAMLSGKQGAMRQYRLRDVVRAIDDAKDDARVKAIVLDLDHFGGAYPATLGEVADALARARAAGKPVLAFATGYTDGGYRLASAASEVWMDPMGGTIFAGPGGSQLYYKGLIDKLGVNAHVYRVGKYKSFVEPYTRTDQSPEAKEAATVLQNGLFDQWKEAIARARPKAKIAEWLTAPDKVVEAAHGDIAQANLADGIVDKLGDRVAFGRRVAELAGGDSGKPAGWFRTIDYDAWLDAHPLPRSGDVGIVTVAGDIVDGKAGPGTAGGDTIAKFIYDGLAKKKLKALVLRVDSPGGSVTASERIRLALLEAKKEGLPVVVSMGGVAASGGFWVSTPGDVIFAEPSTITGSIGIFGIIPTFENTLAKIGVTTDGVKTTPLSGQPDMMGGTNPVTDAVFQSAIDHGYAQFLARVSQSRRMPVDKVNEIAQGRVWIGGTARQLRLVDRFGTLKDAVDEAAKRAKLDPAKVQVTYLEKKPGWTAELARQFNRDNDDDSAAPADAFARVAWERRALVARAIGDVKRLVTGGGVQAACLECGGFGPNAGAPSDARLLDVLLARIGL
ncbi:MULTISPECIES: signal peptide peptidase SppA [unclassified Sphingomonas]|uniref:signal peptide peptidase SppA n=1 Tax=unclassified Sphingomonas TaxID=196159 RepID=UPI000927230F|nr:MULTISPECIES: signal peptide peptidase SppA [unclassified Sphingomonas]MBN8847637.1 signal peptide peptidase SppA [Sphingomonas sp.]OJV31729.1 MAG: signal peptide peptidase SppA [Sphingomonas sp. 67-36]